MRIQGIDGWTAAELQDALDLGGRFVFYEYCISCIFLSLRRPTDVVFLPYDQWGWVRGLPYTLLTLFLGWWGLPWGFIYTPLVLITNLAGGCDVTCQVCAYLASQPGWESLEAEAAP